MQEIFKDIVGYEGLYQISNLGNVKSLERKVKIGGNSYRLVKERIITQKVGTHKYYTISLFNKRYLTHRLVAMTFITNTENKEQVNHIDGNKLNNKLDNLEWVTKSENALHALKMGLTKIHNKVLVLDTNTGIYYDSIKEVAIQANQHYSNMRRFFSKNNKQYKNYLRV